MPCYEHQRSALFFLPNSREQKAGIKRVSGDGPYDQITGLKESIVQINHERKGQRDSVEHLIKTVCCLGEDETACSHLC